MQSQPAFMLLEMLEFETYYGGMTKLDVTTSHEHVKLNN